jgi:hypothetical protein
MTARNNQELEDERSVMGNETHGHGEQQIMAEAIKQEKIRRVMLSGPSCVTSEATVAEMGRDG